MEGLMEGETLLSLLEEVRQHNARVMQLCARHEVAVKEREAALQELVDVYGPDWESLFNSQLELLRSYRT